MIDLFGVTQIKYQFAHLEPGREIGPKNNPLNGCLPTTASTISSSLSSVFVSASTMTSLIHPCRPSGIGVFVRNPSWSRAEATSARVMQRVQLVDCPGHVRAQV